MSTFSDHNEVRNTSSHTNHPHTHKVHTSIDNKLTTESTIHLHMPN